LEGLAGFDVGPPIGTAEDEASILGQGKDTTLQPPPRHDLLHDLVEGRQLWDRLAGDRKRGTRRLLHRLRLHGSWRAPKLRTPACHGCPDAQAPPEEPAS
jgi:hypothetical protein